MITVIEPAPLCLLDGCHPTINYPKKKEKMNKESLRHNARRMLLLGIATTTISNLITAALAPTSPQQDTVSGANHQMFVAGRNNHGQQGTDNTNNLFFNETPFLLTDGIAKVVTDLDNGTLVLKNDGTLWATGQNYQLRFGIGNLGDQPKLYQITNNVSDMALGEQHILILKTDGSLWVAGSNGDGQLGTGNTQTRNTPIQIDNGVTKIAAGRSHSLVLRGTNLWAFGDNFYGQIGNGNNLDMWSPALIASNVTDIAAGYNHSAYISQGKLYVMGENAFGQFGNGTTTNSNIPIDVTPVNVTPVQVACGVSNTGFVDSNGKLWITGPNTWGQHGNGSTSVGPILTFQNGITTIPNINRVEMGAYTTLFTTTDGTLYGMGENDYYNLGLGNNNAQISSPTQIASNVVDFDAGRAHSAFLVSGVLTSSRSYLTNAVTENSWVIDPTNSLGSGATFTVSGSLPSGLQISNGTLVGTIPTEGTYLFSILGVNGIAQGTFDFQIEVLPQPISPYSIEITTNTATYNSWDLDPQNELGSNPTYTVDGVLPAGLRIEDGILHGIVRNVGNYSFKIIGVADTNDFQSSPPSEVHLTFTIRCLVPTIPPVFTSVTFNGRLFNTKIIQSGFHGIAPVTEPMNFYIYEGDSVDISFTWDFIKPPYSFIVVRGSKENERLPDGLAIDGETGRITGTPTELGHFYILVSVKDWRSRGYQWIHLVILEEDLGA